MATSREEDDIRRVQRRTESGRILRLTQEAPAERSPLQRQVSSMVKWVALAALLFVIRLPAGDSLAATFVFALG